MSSTMDVSGVELDDDEAGKLASLRRGEAWARDWFVEAHWSRLHRAAVYFLGWRDAEAEDVVQETFFVALRALPGFRGDSQFYTWLNQICVRLCFKRLRQRRRLLLGAKSDVASALSQVCLEPDALDRLLDEERTDERRRMLQDALEGLQPRWRRLIECRYLRGQSYVEAARELNLPLGTFMSRLARGREKLRRKLERLENGT